MGSNNGKVKPMTPAARKALADKMRAEGKELMSKGKQSNQYQQGQALLFKASEVELKVGEGPYKKQTA